MKIKCPPAVLFLWIFLKHLGSSFEIIIATMVTMTRNWKMALNSPYTAFWCRRRNTFMFSRSFAQTVFSIFKKCVWCALKDNKCLYWVPHSIQRSHLIKLYSLNQIIKKCKKLDQIILKMQYDEISGRCVCITSVSIGLWWV